MVAQVSPAHGATLRDTHVTSRAAVHAKRLRAIHRPDKSSALANAIVAFALGAQGRQVGDGECFSLADQALSTAGARSASAYTEITPDGDYIWGKPVQLSAARPGDILQFRNFRIVRRVTIATKDEAGSISRTQSQEAEERDHHTAVVTQNLGTALVIAEQNMEPLGRVVQRNTIEIASGTTTATNAADSTETTTEVIVDGDIRAYRPQLASPTAITLASRQGS
jgi:uncharacterized cupredoxin-like copper-binding protein